MPETQSTKRLLWLLRALILWVLVIFGRLVWLQVLHHDDLLRLAQSQQQKVVPIQAQRGSILDRSGQPMAKSLPAESVLVNPKRIKDAAVAANLLAPILGLDPRQLAEKIRAASRRDLGFLWVKRKVTAGEADRVRSYHLEFVEFRPETRRFYPHGQLAAHVLGSVGIANPNDTIEQGTAGIELQLDDDLAGIPGQMRVFNDVKQNPYDSVIARKPEPGADITLTIDQNLQYEAEKEIAVAAKESGAKTGSIVVMNPYTGEILAMANWPTFDPNEPPTPGEAVGARSNLAITTPFEPGSVFKVITLAAALETTRLRPESPINCGNGSFKMMGRVIHDHVRGTLTMADVLAKSSNIGAIQIGLRVGDQQLYKYVRKFGFGRKTGVDLPGESPGILRKVENWTPTSIASVAMGQEVGVTSLQLALAGAAVANGGLLPKPKLVLARQKKGGPLEKFADEKPERAIAPETAIRMRQMMEGVVLHGTGLKYATIKGYTSGGKTGSAQIFDTRVHAYTHIYNASFLGFAPVANPQIVVAVTLNGTQNGNAGFGGPVAGPVFSKVAMTALRMLDVPKDLPDSLSTASDSVNDLSKPEQGSRSVSSVTLPPVQADSPATAEESKASKDSSPDRRPFLSSALVGPKVPNFRGMTLRAVLEESAATGVQIEVLGNGLARNQEPPAGSILAPGARVRVQFTR
ncbi:MAG TPA: penicillin-binding protein [Bryobacteraceae bacterium]|nr:penicillin-binding protein [Bryobacteraceae bacterium]